MAKKINPKNPQSAADETNVEDSKAETEVVAGKTKSRKSGRKTGTMHWSDRDLKGHIVAVAWER